MKEKLQGSHEKVQQAEKVASLKERVDKQGKQINKALFLLTSNNIISDTDKTSITMGIGQILRNKNIPDDQKLRILTAHTAVLIEKYQKKTTKDLQSINALVATLKTVGQIALTPFLLAGCSSYLIVGPTISPTVSLDTENLNDPELSNIHLNANIRPVNRTVILFGRIVPLERSFTSLNVLSMSSNPTKFKTWNMGSGSNISQLMIEEKLWNYCQKNGYEIIATIQQNMDTSGNTSVKETTVYNGKYVFSIKKRGFTTSSLGDSKLGKPMGDRTI